MAELGLILFLLAVVAAVTLFAARIGVPYPIPMVVAGLVIGLVPDMPRFEIEPDLVLALFLPPILFSAAFFLSPRELWRNVRPISLLAVGLVFTTTLAVAAVVMALAPQLGWPVAIALGAIVSPPDAIAATSIARQLNLPRRLVIIFEGESLVNDATALTTYRLAVAAVGVTGGFDFGGAAVSFVTVAVGGAIVGLIVGWVASWLLSLLEDPPVEVLISLIVPFTAYLPAEQLGVSGVLATVAAGLLVGFRAPRVMRSDTRILGTGTWKMVIFVVNGLAFLLIGLQLPTVIADLEGYEAGELIGLATAVSLTVIIVRLAWVYPATYLPRWLIPSVARRDPAPPARVPLILGWGGMRGAVECAGRRDDTGAGRGAGARRDPSGGHLGRAAGGPRSPRPGRDQRRRPASHRAGPRPRRASPRGVTLGYRVRGRSGVSEQGWQGFLAADGVDDWVVLHGGATAVFRTGSLSEAAQLAAALAQVAGFEGSGALLTIADARLTVRLTRDMWGLEAPHIELARAVSAVARDHGAVADRAAVQEVQLAIAAKPDAVDVRFWRAVLGYAPMSDDNAVDPLGHGSTVWMQELNEAKPLRHAMHVDVSVAREQAEARVTAALAAGGRIVDDSEAPRSWILSDRAGNRVCVASWPDGATETAPDDAA